MRSALSTHVRGSISDGTRTQGLRRESSVDSLYRPPPPDGPYALTRGGPFRAVDPPLAVDPAQGSDSLIRKR
jgi:hypothetical protein